MELNARKLVEGIYLNNLETINEALTELLRTGREDITIVVLREAIIGQHLFAGSKTATIIGGLISEANPKRVMLRRLAKQLNNTDNNSLGAIWVDTILSIDTGMSIYEWTKSCEKSKNAVAVKKLFKQTSCFGDINPCYALS